MAGVSLLSLVRRLKTVSSTRKITSAMGLVATSKYQRVKRLLSMNEDHFQSLTQVVSDVVSAAETTDSILVNGYDSAVKGNNQLNGSKKLVIIINSVKGMAGGYNSEVMDKALHFIEAEAEVPYVITTGNRGMIFIQKVINQNELEIIPMSDVPSYKNSSSIFKKAMELYMVGIVKEVHVIYTKYLSPVRTEVVSEKLLPLKIEPKEEKGIEFEFIPSAKEMGEKVFTMFLKEKIFNIALHAKTSEQSVRMRAMDSATKNADEILRDLTKQFNRLRQSTITQEITEIVGGAEALK